MRQEQVEIPFDGVRQVKSSFSEIKLGLNWKILMQHWAIVTRDKPHLTEKFSQRRMKICPL